MSAKIERRLAEVEAAARGRMRKGMRHFVKVTDGSDFFENTVKDGNIHAAAVMGIDCKAPEGATLYTAGDLQQLESEGWDVFTIQYVDYSASDSAGRRLWG